MLWRTMLLAVLAGSTVRATDVAIPARLDSGHAPTSSGLATRDAALVDMGGPVVDLCDTNAFLPGAQPVGAAIDRASILGQHNYPTLSNPRESMSPTGCEGTCDGNNGLPQLGGAPITPEQFGSAEPMVLSLNAASDAAVDPQRSGDPLAATIAAPKHNSVSVRNMELLFDAPPCADTDVNCDSFTNGLDIAVVRSPGNWQVAVDEAMDPRADVTRDGAVNGLDVAAIKAPGPWLSSTGPCVCP